MSLRKCIIAGLLTACFGLTLWGAEEILHKIEVYDRGGIGRRSAKADYVVLADSVAIEGDIGPMLWRNVHHTVSLTGDVIDLIVLKPDIPRGKEDGEPNILEYEYTQGNPVDTFFRKSPFMKFNNVSISEGTKYEENPDRYLCYLDGDFEYRAAYNIYKRKRTDNDSLGLYTSGEQYRPYRKVNGIEGTTYSLRKNGDGYRFRYSTYLPEITADGDTVGPLWVVGSLPGGFTRVTEASANDFIFEYDDKGLIWIHLDSKGAIHDINRPEDILQADVPRLVERDFPKTGLYNGLLDIKERLLKKDKGYSINLRTDRCTIMARGFGDDETCMLSAKLRNNFVEKNQQAMFQIFTMMLGEFSPMSDNNPEMFDLFFERLFFRQSVFERLPELMNTYGTF